MKNLVLGTVILASTAALASPVLAQTTTYTNRAAFNTAAGPLTLEDFNGFTADTAFRTAAVDVGAFSLIGSGNRQDDRNFIDAAPFIFGGYFSVDGTSYVQGQVGGFADGTSGFEILFDAPIFAFGADFFDLNDLPGITQITVGQTVLTPGQLAGFFGFTSTDAFTTVRFSSRDAQSIDNFGLDNLAFTAGADGGVPEPATWAMMIGGFALTGGAMRRQRKVTSKVRFA